MKISIGRFLEVSKLLATKSGQELTELITYMSDFAEQVLRALQSKLTVADNLDASVMTINVKHNVAQAVNTSGRIPTGITVWRIVSTTVGCTGLTWYVSDQNKTTVKLSLSGTPVTQKLWTRTSSVVTVTSTGHGLTSGMTITAYNSTGADISGPFGEYTITVTSLNAFTFAQNTSDSTGSNTLDYIPRRAVDAVLAIFYG